MDHHPQLGDDITLDDIDSTGTRAALAEAAAACRACAAACEREPDAAALAECIRADLVCADACELAVRTFDRQPDLAGDVAIAMLNLCVLATQACATECERHADHHDHCARAATACRHAEAAAKDALRRLTATAA